MHKLGLNRVALAALITSLAVPAAAGAQAPPPPTAAGGQAVTALAQGVPLRPSSPSSRGTCSSAPSGRGRSGGGVYRIRQGKAKRVKGSPKAVAGVAWRKGKLYVSSGKRIVVMSKWNGRRFLRKKTLYTAPAGFSGFTGLAFGPDSRLYSGVGLNDQTDQGPDTARSRARSSR
jgi:glucose/arabinose dehydrogenase